MKWIDVEDRLPDMQKVVLVATRDSQPSKTVFHYQPFTGMRIRHHTGGWIWNIDSLIENVEVYMWCEIPELPCETKQNNPL
jgi:hypothetical protein